MNEEQLNLHVPPARFLVYDIKEEQGEVHLIVKVQHVRVYTLTARKKPPSVPCLFFLIGNTHPSTDGRPGSLPHSVRGIPTTTRHPYGYSSSW